MQSTFRKLLLSLGVFIVVGGLCYAVGLFVRTHRIYAIVKTGQSGWRGQLHQFSDDVGIAPVPGATGAQVLAFGPDVPTRWNDRGFRVPLDPPASPPRRPLVLALGCSFTYGFGCVAEDAWPYQLAQCLGGSEINAAVCSHGLAQMLVLGRRLIPEYRPDYVVVQYSTWLADRALSPFAPLQIGRVPTPFFGRDSHGELVLSPPAYASRLFALPIEHYRSTARGLADYLSFLLRVGAPLLAGDDAGLLAFRCRQIFGRVPRPANDRLATERLVYSELADLTTQAGGRMFVVVLGKDHVPVTCPLGSQAGFTVVNAHAALLDRLPARDESTYNLTFTHVRGDPPRSVDGHPNAAAQRLIADTLAAAIRAAPDAVPAQ